MKIYKLPPKGYLKSKETVLGVVVGIIAALVGWFITFRNHENTSTENWPFLQWIVLVVIIAFVVYRMVKSSQDQWLSYQVELTGETITVKQNNLKQILISREEIDSIQELPNRGLCIKSKATNRRALIRVNLDGYHEVRDCLSTWSPIQPTEKLNNYYWWGTIVIFLTVISFGVTFISTSKYIVLVSGGFIIIMLIWGFIAIQFNKNLQKNIKRSSWICLLVLVVILGKILAFFK